MVHFPRRGFVTIVTLFCEGRHRLVASSDIAFDVWEWHTSPEGSPWKHRS